MGISREEMSKKMYQKNSFAVRKETVKTYINAVSSVASIRQFTPPLLRENKSGSYIEFYAFDPELGMLRRKRIKLNRVAGKVKQRQYAKDVLKRLNEQLQHGWNPWIVHDTSNLLTFEEALSRYERHIEKMFSDVVYRKETYVGYKSYIKILREYIQHEHPLHYIYQFDRVFCVDFLDWVFIERNNCAQTRNNYLLFLKIISGFFVEKGYLQARPTDGIKPISKRLFKKGRTDIPLNVIGKIAEYCSVHDPHFLLACYLLYYCFIRPVEMTRLRIRNINIKESTITIPAECSKNKKEQVVTIPKKVLLYAIKIGIFKDGAMSDFIFSDRLKPGSQEINPKIFRDHWAKLRKPLGLKSEYKLYSLKDTGITEMCDNNMTTISIRDQARHSNLAITDIYTRHHAKANPDIIELEGAL